MAGLLHPSYYGERSARREEALREYGEADSYAVLEALCVAVRKYHGEVHEDPEVELAVHTQFILYCTKLHGCAPHPEVQKCAIVLLLRLGLGGTLLLLAANK